MEGDVEIDPPEVTCAKIGHAWPREPVANDGTPAPWYSRECTRCHVVQTAPQPGGPWHTAPYRLTVAPGDVAPGGDRFVWREGDVAP